MSSATAHEEQEDNSQWDPTVLPLAHFLFSHSAIEGEGGAASLPPLSSLESYGLPSCSAYTWKQPRDLGCS